MKRANFIVFEIWTVECPECFEEQAAETNEDNPCEPMEVVCESCGEHFILTYERDL